MAMATLKQTQAVGSTSSSSRDADRILLCPSTVYESMKFNDYLRRRGTPLVAGKRRRLLLELVSPATHEGDENDDEDEDSDTNENKIEILEWEKEWWQKV